MFVLDSLPPAEQAPSIDVTHWRRFRQERAYVRLNGKHIGYRDLRTGTIHAFDDAHADAIARATVGLRAKFAQPAGSPARR